ncbi:MAG: DUF2164 domain-containing protein [Gemmatimonadetes bacterium]|jgi:uncharacterized protein (DUF2164 family)|nr:DUF2164 domain-containing protein [Gemmatimonadota bacterium]MBT6144260.1 DUF2164 domain-containing protein [Gemmatimonadota bacterium]MBT7864354.1 DUF2164 domain-containing protein [Gemmatimonadota bacterium]
MRIKLSDTRKRSIYQDLAKFYTETFDEELSEFQSERLLEFFIVTLGPPVYNQGVQDARAFLADKLDDLEGDIYEPEPPV